MPSAVAWRYDATTQPWLRALFLLGAGLVYGLFALVGALLVFSLGLLLWQGGTGTRLLVLLLALVGGPFSLLYLMPAIRDPAQRPTFGMEGVERVLTARERVGVGLAGGAVLAVAGLVDPSGTMVVAAVGVLAGGTYLLAATRGELDPESRTVRNRAREFELEAVRGYRTRTLGPLTLVTLALPTKPGRLGGVPARLLVPTERLEAVTAALDAVVAETEDEMAEGRDPNPAVRLVAGVMALGCLGTGVGALVLVGPGIGWYVAAMGGLFAVVFGYVAHEG